MTNKRLLTDRVKKVREIVENMIEHSERLEMEVIGDEGRKCLNIVTEIELSNEDKRKGER